jgi:hypothetical protein
MNGIAKIDHSDLDSISAHQVIPVARKPPESVIYRNPLSAQVRVP